MAIKPTRPIRKPTPHGEQPDDQPLLTASEWSRRYGFSRTTTRKLLQEGMPYIQVDRHVRIEPRAALEWMRMRSAVRTSEPLTSPGESEDAACPLAPVRPLAVPDDPASL